MTTISVTDLPARIAAGQTLAAIDLGDRTIGVAVSDRGLAFAHPRPVILRRKFTEDARSLLDLAADRGGDFAREHILVGEVVVEAAFRDLAGFDDFIHADAIDITRREKSSTRAEQRLAGAHTASIRRATARASFGLRHDVVAPLDEAAGAN